MAKTSLVIKQSRLETRRLTSIQNRTNMKHPTKHYNRCNTCGRVGSYIRDFGICRVCFRKYAREGLMVGVRKASW